MRRKHFSWAWYLIVVAAIILVVLLLPGFGHVIGTVVIVIALVLAAWSAWQRAVAARRWAAIGSFYSLTPEQFEQHVASTFEYLGYGAMMTPRVGDQGVDIIAQKSGESIAIQVKRYSDRAPNSAVQAIHTGAVYYGCDRALLVCLGGFSKAAVEVAGATNVELMDGKAYADLVHRVAPSTRIASLWLPQGGTLIIVALLIALGILAIVFDSMRGSLIFHPGYSALPVPNRRGLPLFPIALVLITIGLLSMNKGRRRRRR